MHVRIEYRDPKTSTLDLNGTVLILSEDDLADIAKTLNAYFSRQVYHRNKRIEKEPA